MYLIPQTSRNAGLQVQPGPGVFNIKWDRDHTRYSPLPLPAATSTAVQAGAAVAKIRYRGSRSISFARPVDTSACMGCNCSGRGIGVPPQKRMSGMGAMYGRLGGPSYNSATNYVFTFEPAAQVQAVANGMIAEGYDPRIIGQLVAAGATSEDLQNLWDNYTNSANANDPDGFARPALAMLQTIQSLHPQIGAANVPPVTYAQGAQAIPALISNAASTAAQDVAAAFTPAAGAPTVPWYLWALGGAGLFLALRRA